MQSQKGKRKRESIDDAELPMSNKQAKTDADLEDEFASGQDNSMEEDDSQSPDDRKPERPRVRKKSAKFLEMEEFEMAEKSHYGKKLVLDNVKTSRQVIAPPGKYSPTKVKVETNDPPTSTGTSPETPGPSVSPVSSGSKTSGHSKSSVIKLLLNSPAQNQSLVLMTKPLTSQSSKSEGVSITLPSPSLASRKKTLPKTVTKKIVVTKKTAKLKEEPEDEFPSESLVIAQDKVVEKDLKMKFIMGSKPSVSAVSKDTTKPLKIDTSPGIETKTLKDAGKSDGSLKMKFILSPKEKSDPGQSHFIVESPSKSQGSTTSPAGKIDSGGGATKLFKKVKKKKEADVKTTQVEHVIVTPTMPVIYPNIADQHPRVLPKVSAQKITSPSSTNDDKKAPVKVKKIAKIASSTIDNDSAIDTTFDFDADIDTPSAPKEKKGFKLIKKKVKNTEGPIIQSPAEEIVTDTHNVPMYSDTNVMATKLKTRAEKRATKKGKRDKIGDPDKPKKRRGLTAYMMYCNAHRQRVIADNPGIDFAHISRRFGEIWQALPEKEKLSWKRRAKKASGKGSTLISTGKKGLKFGGLSHALHPSSTLKTVSTGLKSSVPAVAAEAPQVCPSKPFGTEPVDVAAHLKLLGESLGIIGRKLQEHKGLIAVQGSLPVLLDSVLCAFGPLMCLTAKVPEMNGCSQETLSNTLDNIAYIMPGL